MTLGHEFRALELDLNHFSCGGLLCNPRCEPLLLGSLSLSILKAIIALAYMYLCPTGQGGWRVTNGRIRSNISLSSFVLVGRYHPSDKRVSTT